AVVAGLCLHRGERAAGSCQSRAPADGRALHRPPFPHVAATPGAALISGEGTGMMRSAVDADYLASQLKALLSIDSPTGYTDNAVRSCSRELERLGLEPELTRRGAIRAVRRGARRQGARAIVSHIDTLGAQVKAIKPNGRLALAPIGHWSARFAEGARV